ncbi:endoplasmic reticulum aminopeptidase 2-like [Esox lucius]|nr:endoplasmic reticulum aminopeptidase 2-like [Esox lucius]
MDDTFHLARQGWVPYGDAFTLSMYMHREEEYLPITVFINHISKMIVQFSFNQQACISRLLREHLWRVLGRQARSERWEEGGSLPAQSRRVRLLDLALRGGLWPEAEQEALRLFHFWMAKDGQHPLPMSLRGLIFRVGVWRGGYAEWIFLLQQYRLSQSGKDQVTMLAALCRTTNHTNILWLLNASLQNHIIKTQDFKVVVDQLAFRPKTNEMLWRFIQQHWDQLVSKFPLGSLYLSDIVTATTSHFNSTQKYDEVYEFFVTQRSLGHLSFVQQSLEMIKLNMRWLQANTKAIQSWLQQTYPVTYSAYPLCKKEVTYRFKWGTTIRFRA